MLSYALTVKGEGMIVSKSKTILRAVLNRYTFKADSLSISNIGTLAPMHLIVLLQRSSMRGFFERKLFIGKGKEGIRWGFNSLER